MLLVAVPLRLSIRLGLPSMLVYLAHRMVLGEAGSGSGSTIALTLTSGSPRSS